MTSVRGYGKKQGGVITGKTTGNLSGRGVPWFQIMGNEFECLVVRGGHGSHLLKSW